MEKKLFKEVFPGLKFDKTIDDLIGQTEVENITMFKSEKKMVISISSHNLIAKKLIYRAEEQIKQFVFGHSSEKCIIKERFILSKQYKLKHLTDIYKDSFLEELKNISYVDFRLLDRAEWYYNENILTLAVEDTYIARSHSHIIKEYLETTYRERFGMEVSVGFNYTEEQKTKLRDANELRLKQELAAIEANQLDVRKQNSEEG